MIAALAIMHVAEVTLDLGVLVALIIATFAVVMWWSGRPSFLALALVMPLAGLFEADPKWRSTTIILYSIFGVVALVAVLTKRR